MEINKDNDKFESLQESEEHFVNILSLPVELLVIIVSFLPTARDKAKLRYVSRKLRVVSEAPSLWNKFIWPLYDRREERSVVNVLRDFGDYINLLIFPDHVTESKLIKMLRYCSSVIQLVLPAATKVDSEKLRIAVKYMTSLKQLEVQLSTDIKPLLQIVGLTELAVHVPLNCHHFCVSWVQKWIENAFRPFNLILFTPMFSLDTEKSILEFLLKFTYVPPLGYRSYFTLWYNFKVPLNLFPSFPEFQLEISDKIILLCAKACNFGLLGIGWDVCVLTECICDGRPVYRAKIGSQSLFDIVHYRKIPMQDKVFSTLDLVTEFDLAYSEGHLYSGHLEQLAIACPNLQHLNLQYNLECLRNLQGLRMIACHCKNLRGLNMTCIPIANVQSQVELWSILSDMKLTYLVMHVCLFHPVTISYEQQVIKLFQKCSSLQALQ